MKSSLLLETKGALRQLGIRARKGLGQHFLIDRRALSQIVAAAELCPEDVVVEVGPGLGALTRELARKSGRVLAVELDPQLASALQQSLADFPNVSVICADILELDLGQLKLQHQGYKVVANLPYYVAAPILRHFLEASLQPKLMVVMLQKEVAEKIVASPGNLGLLSLAIQLYARPRIVGRVPARSFYPPPKVDSAILRLEILEKPAVEADRGRLFEIARAGFSAPRKQLRNALSGGLGLPPPEITRWLKAAGIEQHRRAETLTLEEWAKLARMLPGNLP